MLELPDEILFYEVYSFLEYYDVLILRLVNKYFLYGVDVIGETKIKTIQDAPWFNGGGVAHKFILKGMYFYLFHNGIYHYNDEVMKCKWSPSKRRVMVGDTIMCFNKIFIGNYRGAGEVYINKLHNNNVIVVGNNEIDTLSILKVKYYCEYYGEYHCDGDVMLNCHNVHTSRVSFRSLTDIMAKHGMVMLIANGHIFATEIIDSISKK